MNVPIKFRGRVAQSWKTRNGEVLKRGDYVYGLLVQYGERYWLRRQEEDFAVEYPVELDSVTQLAGYDVDGNEIYEHDTADDGIVISARSNCRRRGL